MSVFSCLGSWDTVLFPTGSCWRWARREGLSVTPGQRKSLFDTGGAEEDLLSSSLQGNSTSGQQ